MKRIYLSIIFAVCIILGSMAGTPIQDRSQLTAEQMAQYILRNNPDFDPEIIDSYYFTCDIYGIRADLVICQAIFETGWFKYQGSAVTPEQHNYCGLGVERNGIKGNGFPSIDMGVTAHVQHLYAYCSGDELPQGEDLIDPRFTFVTRGVAQDWEDLGRYWARNPSYSNYIFSIYDRIYRHYNPEQ